MKITNNMNAQNRSIRFQMKDLFFGYRSVSRFSSIGLLILRLVVGFSMMLHGAPKLAYPMNWMGDAVPGILQLLAVIAEFGGGLALLTGLLVPLASSGIAITMLNAVLLAHVPVHDPLYRLTVSPTNEGIGVPFMGLPWWLVRAGGHSPAGSGSAELAILFGVIASCLFFSGPGQFSIDYVLSALAGKRKSLESEADFV